MRAYFYRYGSLCEPAVITAFQNLGIDVFQEDREIKEKNIPFPEIVQSLATEVLTGRASGNPYDFIFSINFYPGISDICRKLGVLYISWTVDCPVEELFSRSIKNPCNRIFLFDYAQYERFSPANPECIFYLPLAADMDMLSGVLSRISEDDASVYDCDISMVGSLYREKSPLHSAGLLTSGLKLTPTGLPDEVKVFYTPPEKENDEKTETADDTKDNQSPSGSNEDRESGSKEKKEKSEPDIDYLLSLPDPEPNPDEPILTDYDRGYLRSLMVAQQKVYGQALMECSLKDEIALHLKETLGDLLPLIHDPFIDETELIRFMVSEYALSYGLAVHDREESLLNLAVVSNVHLYTQSCTAYLEAYAKAMGIPLFRETGRTSQCFTYDKLGDASEEVLKKSEGKAGLYLHGGAATLTEMPVIFNRSKINLNITMRAIQTGMSARIFDVMGAGGFLMTNFQSEIPEYFELGKDIATYESLKDLLDKCRYYLSHEQERLDIAESGQRKVAEVHTYENRILEMLGTVFGFEEE